MRPPFRMKDIAFQAGLSLATVDRAIHNRGCVHPATQRRIDAAIRELREQQEGTATSGKALTIDVLMVAPDRFSGAVRSAFQDELPHLGRARLHIRFDLQEHLPVDRICRKIDAIAKRGSHGIILKVPDLPEVAARVRALASTGCPVLTLVTDLTRAPRTAYIGMDNAAAGRTAADLLVRFTRGQDVCVLVSASSRDFQGEEARIRAFVQQMTQLRPEIVIHKMSGGFGRNVETVDQVTSMLRAHPEINAVYSVGGGNRAILTAFDTQGLPDPVFIAHDMDADNRALLSEGRIDLVLHHDLRRDARTACQWVLKHHRILPAQFTPEASSIQIATRYSVG